MNSRYASIAVCLFFIGCKDDAITTYRLAKDDSTPTLAAPMMGGGPTPGAMPMLPGMAPAASAADVHWSVPAGWAQQPPSAMRIGSFLIKGGDGQIADVSIVPLSGPAGGELANINRWRGQISLPPISEDDLTSQTQLISPHGRKMHLFDFASVDPLIDNRYKKRVVAAIYTKGNASWFFKMIGEDETVENAKPAFLQLLHSLRFNTNE